MLNPVAIWGFVKALFKQWKLVTIAALGVLLFLQKTETRHWKGVAQDCGEARKLEQSEIRRVRAEQKAADAEHARKVEAADANANQEISSGIQKQLADAQRRARILAERLRAGAGETNPSGAREPPMPRAPNTPGSPAGASGIPDVSPEDRLICEVNTIKAKGWQDWWKKIEAIGKNLRDSADSAR